MTTRCFLPNKSGTFIRIHFSYSDALYKRLYVYSIFMLHIYMPKAYTVFVPNHLFGNNSGKSEPIGTKFYRKT